MSTSTKRLLAAWALFDIFLLAAGALSLTLSIVWRAPNLLLNLTFSNTDLLFGTILGIILLSTFVISIIAIIQRNNSIAGLVVLNWTLLIDAIVILIVGTYIWVYTLHERNNYHTVFGRQSNATKILIQDTLKCCGYFSATDEVAFGGSFLP